MEQEILPHLKNENQFPPIVPKRRPSVVPKRRLGMRPAKRRFAPLLSFPSSAWECLPAKLCFAASRGLHPLGRSTPAPLVIVIPKFSSHADKTPNIPNEHNEEGERQR